MLPLRAVVARTNCREGASAILGSHTATGSERVWSDQHSVRVKYDGAVELEVPEQFYKEKGWLPPFATCRTISRDGDGDAWVERAADRLQQSADLHRRPLAPARRRNAALLEARRNGPQ